MLERNPYEMIYMSRSGQDTALSALFAQYHTYCLYLRDSVTKRARIYGDAEEEILLEMRLGMMDACHRYREDQAASWRTFMTLVLKRRAVNVIRKADVRDWIENTIPFDSLVADEDSVYDCFAQKDAFADPEYCLYYHEAQNKLSLITQQLDQEERKYLVLWSRSMTAKQGSALMHINEKKWYKRMETVQKKVEGMLKELN